MRMARWIILGVVIIALVVGNLQGLWLRGLLCAQNVALLEIQREQEEFERRIEEMGQLLVGIPNSKEILETVLHESLESFHRHGKPITDFFYSQDYDLEAGWTSDGFKNPAGSWLMAYSKRAFSYPVLYINCVWPTLNNIHPNRPTAIVEFESGPQGGVMRSGFRFIAGSARLGGGSAGQRVDIYIKNLLPADYDSVKHQYMLKLNKCNVEAFIDGELVGIVLFGLPEAIPIWENNSPYAIGSSKSAAYASKALFMIAHEPAGDSLNTQFNIDIDGSSAGNDFLMQDGDPLPSRQYALYTENTSTKWAGLTTSGSLITSHPVPVWGYERKTLLFQADATGELKVQVYTGGDWRTIKTQVLTANELFQYDLTAEVPIVRCTYDPANNDTIAVAEWSIS